MKALRFHGRRDVRYDDVPDVIAGDDDIILRVLFNGLCGTDLHEYLEGPIVASATPHPLTGRAMPCILGHEFSGEVVAVGSRITDLQPGALVAVQPIQTCGDCPRCRTGRRHLCPLLAAHGFHRAGGGLAERTTVRRDMVHVLPVGVSAEQGALVEPMAVAYHAVRRTRAIPGNLVAIFGAGPIGIGALLTLTAMGISAVVCEPSLLRRKTAARLGAAHVLDPADEDVATAIADLTSGLGAAAAIEAAGAETALRTALASTRPDGTVVVVAVHAAPVDVTAARFFGTEVYLTGSSIYTDEDFRAVIELMRYGAYPAEGWVESIAFDKVVEEGFLRLQTGAANKILIDVGGAVH